MNLTIDSKLILDNALIIVALVAGLRLGLLIADIDLAPPIPLKHRSAWSHGPLLPVFLIWLHPSGVFGWGVVGLLLGMGLHLAYDLYPKKWGGVANISLHPIPLRLPNWASWSFLAVTVWVCSWGAVVLLPPLPIWGVGLLFGGAVVMSIKYIESQTATWPIIGRFMAKFQKRRVLILSHMARLLNKTNFLLPVGTWGILVIICYVLVNYGGATWKL
jgi:hypothetical protein